MCTLIKIAGYKINIQIGWHHYTATLSCLKVNRKLDPSIKATKRIKDFKTNLAKKWKTQTENYKILMKTQVNGKTATLLFWEIQ